MRMPAVKKLYYGAVAALAGLIVPALALAQEGEGAGGGTPGTQLIAIAGAIAISLAAAGGAVGQGMAASSAFQSMARNPGVQPKIFTSMILGLAFIESLVIYALLISILLVLKVK
jgi:F-type H+-transporting ATPase subunit c